MEKVIFVLRKIMLAAVMIPLIGLIIFPAIVACVKGNGWWLIGEIASAPFGSIALWGFMQTDMFKDLMN